MHLVETIGKACLIFIFTNIDDAFVLVTFFAESATSRNLTPWKIILGQYIGFTVIMAISMVGFAVALAVPTEPVGFLGLLPILLGVWEFLELVIPDDDDDDEEEGETKAIASARSIFKVASISVMNGSDDIGTYIPLFSQLKGAEIAVYAVVYYIMLGVWCLLAFLVMKQKHVLRVCEKYSSFVVPLLYIGIGIYIVIDSHCFPWSIGEINQHLRGNNGQIIVGVVAAGTMAVAIGVLTWVRLSMHGSEGAIRLGEGDHDDAENHHGVSTREESE